MRKEQMSADYINGLDISDAFKDILKLAIEQPVNLMRMETPKTADQWRDAIAATDAEREGEVKQLLNMLPVSYAREALGGVPIYRMTPETPHADFADCVFLHFHGGAYVFSGGLSCLVEPAVLNMYLPMAVISVDYAMPPDHPAPRAIEDGLNAYRALLQETPAERIITGGTSAGAGLMFSVLQAARDEGLPMPRASFAGTPWVDISCTGDTLTSFEGLDRVLVTYHGLLGGAAKLYANGMDLKDPRVSPLYGDFTNMPPCFLVSGTRDMLLSDTVRLHRKLRRTGVPANLTLFEAHSHADYLFGAMTPEAGELFAEFHQFLTT